METPDPQPTLSRPGSASPAALERYASLAREPLAPATGTSSASGRLWAYRGLLVQLIRRELKVRYKDSSLGFLWSLLRPLSLLVVYYVAIGQFLGAQRSIPSFAIFIFTGLTLWQLFSEIVGGGTGSIVANAGLVKKVYLPREIFPLSIAGCAMFNFAIMFLVLFSATIVAGQVPTGSLALRTPGAAGTAPLRARPGNRARRLQRLPPRHPVPRRDRAHGALLGDADRLLMGPCPGRAGRLPAGAGAVPRQPGDVGPCSASSAPCGWQATSRPRIRQTSRCACWSAPPLALPWSGWPGDVFARLQGNFAQEL